MAKPGDFCLRRAADSRASQNTAAPAKRKLTKADHQDSYYDNSPQPAAPAFSALRRFFPILWKTHKFFPGSAFFRRFSRGLHRPPGGKPGGKCGQPGLFPRFPAGYFGGLCLPKTTPCGRRERMSNCNFSGKMPKDRKNKAPRFTLFYWIFRGFSAIIRFPDSDLLSVRF